MNCVEKMKVDLNALASDVIIRTETEFRNETTKECGQNLEDVIRSGKRFIICTSNYLNNHELCGYYGLHNKENDEFLFLTASYDWKKGWQEIGRCIVYKEDGKLHSRGNKHLCKVDDIDIGGQAAVCKNKEGHLEVIIGTGIHSLNVFASKSAYVKEAMSFCPEIIEKHNYFYDGIEEMLTLCDPLEINEIATNYANTAFIVGNIVYSGNEESKDAVMGAGAVNQEVLKMIGRCAKAEIMGKLEKNNQLIEPKEDILESHNGVVFSRRFWTAIEVDYPFENSKIHLIEHRREAIDLVNSYPDDLGYNYFVHAGDMTGSLIEYTAGPLYDWTNMVKEALDIAKDNDLAAYIAFKEKTNLFLKKYRFVPSYTLKVCTIIAKNPVIEKLYHLQCENSESLKYYLAEKMANGDIEEDSDICSIFGRIDKGKTLNDMLGLPKGALEIAVREGKWCTLHVIKRIFTNNKAREYLRRMDRDTFTKLLKCVDKLDNFREDSIIMEVLVAIFGHANWQGYARHISSFEDIIERDIYEDYLDILVSLGDAAAGAEWKLKGPALLKARESFKKVLESYSKKTRDLCDTKIKGQEDIFKKLCYTGKKYIVTYPKDGDDIVLEGIKLHHCAKEFVQAVANGVSILMFIRKADAPDKPFFTLEIRSCTVRQCHGNQNRNINSEPGLDEFLKEYCKEKNLIYNSGEIMKGV